MRAAARPLTVHAATLAAIMLALALMMTATPAPAGATSDEPGDPADLTEVRATTDRAGTATRDGLPAVASGPRPGPDALYLPAPRAPQLENTGPWQADPILISGTHAYRDGEWLYQDFLFDDHGATGVIDSGEPYGISTNLYSPRGGTFTYPDDERYRHNAADLVELRITALVDATALRVTLNTMVEPDLTALTIALGDAGEHAWPAGAGVTSPAEVFLTAVGDTATLVDAATGEDIGGATSTVDLERRQVDLRIPHTAWDPGTDTVPVTIGVGLWDAEAGTYLAPQPGPANETTPGGGLPGGPALVNVGPRLEEPTPLLAGVTMADTAAGARALAPWWRDRQQSLQLTQGDLAPFATEVDFAKLGNGTTDEATIPTAGPMDRIHASRYIFGQGVEPERICFAISSTPTEPGTECQGRYVGQLQPYAIYVPEGEPPAGGWGITLLMHSLSANHNQYLGTANQVQLGERGEGHVVITPEARGPDGFYTGIPEATTFEAWADAARHYPINADKAAASGYSMGGFGTYRLLARWPDLFAGGFTVVGAPGTVEDQLRSLTGIPFLSWNAAADELVNIQTSEEAHAALVEAEIVHTHDLFVGADHLTLAGNDEYTPGAEFLGDLTVDRDPATVRYVLDPSEDSRDVVADHAYWLSGLTLADPDGGVGEVEVHSGASGEGRPGAVEVVQGGGVLTGGQNQAMPYIRRDVVPAEGSAGSPADRLEVTASNIATITVDPLRAGVTCAAEVVVDSETPVEVVLDGCGPTTVGRVAGPTRIDTAVAASRAAFIDGRASAAVIARADDFADALAGGPLAVASNAPLLLSWADDVPAATMDELARALPEGATVHVLGGTAALSTTVTDELAEAGWDVVRHAGATRFETSVRIAEAIGSPDAVVLADGTSFADAVVAAPRAAASDGALLLTAGATMPAEVAEAIGGRDVVTVGPAASAAHPTAAAAFTGAVSGSVAVDVATHFAEPRRVGIARGDDFADALAGGALLGRDPAGPILLVGTDAVPAPVRTWLADTDRLDHLVLLGGTAAISPAVEADLRTLVAAD